MANRAQDPRDRNYKDVLIDDKPKSEYSVDERRKYILQKIEEQGIPSNVDKGKIAEECDVSRQMIHKDIKILKDYMANNMDRDFDSIADAIIRWSVKEAVKEGDYRQARRGATEWQKFLQEAGEKDKEPDKIELTGDEGLDVGFTTVEDDDESEE